MKLERPAGGSRSGQKSRSRPPLYSRVPLEYARGPSTPRVRLGGLQGSRSGLAVKSLAQRQDFLGLGVPALRRAAQEYGGEVFLAALHVEHAQPGLRLCIALRVCAPRSVSVYCWGVYSILYLFNTFY